MLAIDSQRDSIQVRIKISSSGTEQYEEQFPQIDQYREHNCIVELSEESRMFAPISTLFFN
jgi:hypothetical protein